MESLSIADPADQPTPRRKYSYTPLEADEIRILHLSPGKTGAPLHAMLEHVSLAIARETDYETISYAWGSQSLPHQVEFEDGSYLDITTSLYEALQNFRYSDGGRVLWADALCINQNDRAERSAQVAIMGQIFRNSFRVLVWLGPGDDDDGKVFAAMDACARVPPNERTGDDNHFAWIEANLQACFAYDEHETPSACLYSFGLLLQRPWFSRLWVVEEVTLGRAVRLYSGERFVNWEEFKSTVFQLKEFRMSLLSEDYDIWKLDREGIALACETAAQIEFRRGASQSLFSAAGFLTAMHTFSQRDCREAQDRIYALRQFLGIEDVDALKPNYDLSAGEVYKRAALTCLASGRARAATDAVPHASLLFGLVGTERSNGGLKAKDLSQRPSWVPDFNNLSENSRGKHDRYCWPELAQFDHYDERTQIRFSADGPTCTQIFVKGNIFGKIVSILPSSGCPRERGSSDIHSHEFRWQVLPKLITWLEACNQYIGGTDDALRGLPGNLILCCDDPNELELDNEFLSSDIFCNVHLVTGGTPDRSDWMYDTLRPFLAYDHHPRLDSSRNLCRITVGHVQGFAWVPGSAEVGDRLAVFAGAPYPFVVRLSAPEESYRLLGDAHICGLPRQMPVDYAMFIAQVQSELLKVAREIAPASVLLKDGADTSVECQLDPPDDRWDWITLI